MIFCTKVIFCMTTLLCCHVILSLIIVSCNFLSFCVVSPDFRMFNQDMSDALLLRTIRARLTYLGMLESYQEFIYKTIASIESDKEFFNCGIQNVVILYDDRAAYMVLFPCFVFDFFVFHFFFLFCHFCATI